MGTDEDDQDQLDRWVARMKASRAEQNKQIEQDNLESKQVRLKALIEANRARRPQHKGDENKNTESETLQSQPEKQEEVP